MHNVGFQDSPCSALHKRFNPDLTVVDRGYLIWLCLLQNQICFYFVQHARFSSKLVRLLEASLKVFSFDHDINAQWSQWPSIVHSYGFLRSHTRGRSRRVLNALKRESSLSRVKNATLFTREPRVLYSSFIRTLFVHYSSFIRPFRVNLAW